MSNKDQIQRFMFDQLGARGQLVGLNESYLEATSNHDYPVAIQQLLGEFMTAATLLSTTIKFNGSLTLQAQGDGELSMIRNSIPNGASVGVTIGEGLIRAIGAAAIAGQQQQQQLQQQQF